MDLRITPPATSIGSEVANERVRQVAIVMVTWNAIDHTRRAMESLRGTKYSSWRLIAVDNGSRDGTPEWVGRLPGVTLIPNKKNLGFTKACNQAIAATDPNEDIVLLNNDVVVQDPEWLSILQKVAYATPDTGIVGTRLVDGKGKLLHAGSYMPPLKLHGQQIGGLELDVNQFSRDRPVESVVFAQAYLRRDCLDQLGPLDEDLFAYFEDSDYCLRALSAGWRVMYTGRVTSIHHERTSTSENRTDFWSLFQKSQKTFKAKWATWLENDRYEGDVGWHSVIQDSLGYGVQSRKLMQGMHFAGLKLAYRNAYGRHEAPTGDPLLDDLTRRRFSGKGAQIAFCQADAFNRVKGRCRIGWTMLEVTGLPKDWVASCNAMDEVWVPASFNLDTFSASGVRVPLRRMPLGVDLDYFNPGIAGFRTTDRFTFLSVFEWGERKAPEILFRAFAEEFGKSDDVVLIASVANRDPRVNVWEEFGALDLPEGVPIVLMVNRRLPGYQMGSLYRSADCFVLPSRGEGWGMPVLEAMACGLPVIATAWSGPADFLHDGIAFPLQVASMVDAEARCPYYAGFQWAEPDFEHLRFLLRQVYDNRDQARAKGVAAAAEVASNYSLENSVTLVRTRLQELDCL